MTWDWSRFQGSAEMLKYMRRDLAALKPVLGQAPAHRVAVQAGGCLGLYPKFLAERFARVYTCEPDPENFLALCHNAPEPNIVKLQAALGCVRGGVRISHERRSRKPGRAHEGIRHIDGPGPIPTLLLDDLALPICDLLCLDCEGYELFALRGAAETIRRCRPVIVLEMNEMMGYVGVTEVDLRDQLTAYGYRFDRAVGSSDRLFLPMALTTGGVC